MDIVPVLLMTIIPYRKGFGARTKKMGKRSNKKGPIKGPFYSNDCLVNLTSSVHQLQALQVLQALQALQVLQVLQVLQALQQEPQQAWELQP